MGASRRVAEDKLYVDELYDWLIVRRVGEVARLMPPGLVA